MTWSVNDIYKLVLFLTRKNQSSSISSTDLFYAWNTEQTAYFQDLLGRWQNRNNGKSGANTGLIENETIMTKLSPFTIPIALTITAHKATKPSDFVYELALRINGEEVNKINHNQIFAVNKSVIDPASTTDNKFYAVEYEDYYDLLPTTLPTASITELTLDYIKQPANILWGYTFDADNRQVYNAGTSVQPEWLFNDVIEITKRTLTSFGVSYKDNDFQNFGKTTIATGN